MFGKGTITQTIGAEPMVNLDAAAITQRIGSISHPEAKPEPVYQPMIRRDEPAQPRWRSYMRARPTQ